MSTVSQRFNKFISNLKLSENQINDAKTKYNNVCTKLHDNYYSTKYNGSTKLLVGSYGKRTAIAPPSDVDVLFKMPSTEYDRYNSYSGNGQSQLLQDIKNILLKKYPNTNMRGDGQVVMVNFVSYSIEVVPGFKLTNGHYYIPDTHDGGTWKEINPDFEKTSLSNSNSRSNGNTIKLIKMIKAWKYYCNVPIKSLVIELTAVKFLENWQYYDKSSVYYDWMIRDYFEKLVNSTNDWCFIPGTIEILNYGDSWESKAKTALNNAKKACDCEDDKDSFDASYEWRKIFGMRFEY